MEGDNDTPQSGPETVLIRYIGPKRPKHDNVRPHSKRVWKGKGDILPVGVDEFHAYLRHPDEFERVDHKKLKGEAAKQINTPEGVEVVCGMIEVLESEQDCLRVIDAASARIEAIKNPPPPVEEQPQPEMTPEQAAAHEEKLKKIAGAIATMDQTSKDQFTEYGMPRMPVLKRITGLLITEAEMKASLKLLPNWEPKMLAPPK